MRRAFPAVPLTLVLLSLAWAGCLGGSDAATPDPAETPEAPAPPDGFRMQTGNTTNGTGNDTTLLQPHNVYRLALADRSFTNEVLRFAVVARSNVTLASDISFRVGTYDHEDGCIAASGATERNNTTRKQGGFIVWAYENSFRTGLHAAGTPVSFDPLPFDGAIEVSGQMTQNAQLSAGDRFVVEIGGRDASFLSESTVLTANGTQAPSWLNVTLDVTGDAHLVELDPAPIRCGVGPAQSTAPMAAAKVPLGQPSAIDATIGLETTNASSLLWIKGGSLAGEATVRYHDQTHTDPNALASTGDNAGPLSITFDQWTGRGGEGAWFLGDVAWDWILGAPNGP